MPSAETEEGDRHLAKKARRSDNAFLRSWAWKREHRPDKVRFERPYSHPVSLPSPGGDGPGGDGGSGTLTIRQRRFKEQGFASTVWDSSILLAKYFERQGEGGVRAPGAGGALRPLRALDLSAGCGLVACVLCLLGADVTATDLGPNLPLIRENCDLNGERGRAWRAEARGGGQARACAEQRQLEATLVVTRR